MAIPFSRLQPARLGAIARLLGLKPTPAREARTLEIGCATGGHIIPLAAQYPGARFVGLDISPAQIEQGQQRIDRLGLANIELQARSLTELGPQDGLFDYIICHGVYSWIPQEVREALMRVVKERLAPDGVAVISFNVLPGWRLFQVVRDSVILHAGGATSHAERSAQARRLFTLMEKHGSTETTYGGVWRKEAPRMARLPDFYLAHELFEDNNTPCTFLDFMRNAESCNLAYLAETRVLGNIPENSSAERAALIHELSGGELLATEQYIDIVTGRTFRESLLVQPDRAATADRSFDEARLEALHFVTPPDFEVKPVPGGVLIKSDNTEIDINDTTVGAALRAMAECFPRTSSLASLTSSGSWSAEDRANLASVLMTLVCRGIIDVMDEPIVCAGLSERPRVWSLAASDAEAGLDQTATPRHTLFDLTPLARFALPLLDGSHTRADVLERLLAETLKGEARITDAAGPVTDTARIRELCATMLDRLLANLASAGLLAA
jgi:SAM-dependent methyltransferase